MEKITEFLKTNPEYFGFLFVLLGVVNLMAAIRNANWLFGDVNSNTYNIKKIDGLVNWFGRKRARYIVGFSSIGVILAGIFWYWAFAFFYAQ